ncbi:MAG TPA: putative transporter [Chthoniobacterales bacterium]|nr:putative transporter [Chthoniobacterales bacterium]
MNWLLQIHATHAVAHAIGILALVCLVGIALGSVKVRGIGLGTAGVLFAGILTGYFSNPVDHATLEFVKEFGLVLFIFTIGLQLGPGFLAALRQQGLGLNALAATVVALGALTASTLGWLLGMDPAAALGLLSGATTNTPSLGAAQQTLSILPGVSLDRQELPALAYAVSYPVAIAGIIGALLALKALFRVDPVKEAEVSAAEQRSETESLERRTLIVDNPNLEGLAVEAIPGRLEMGVTVSRIRRGDEAEVRLATSDTVLKRADRIVAVGTGAMLDQFQRVVGHRSDEDLLQAPGSITAQAVVVTSNRALGKTVAELGLDHLHGVVTTRVTRADLEMSAVPSLRLHFGDVLQLVGDQASIEKAAAFLGNSLKELNEMHFIPLFLGIAFGIALGTVPIAMPGLPQPLRLGLAGGVLIVALVLGRLGRIGRVVWHMPANVNLAFREFGIALFLAAVGLTAGAKFFSTVFSSVGALWLFAGFVITVLPLLLVGVFARAVLKMNFTTLSGLVAGSMTDPPALAFASNISRSDGPMVSYATVYPLIMLLRILSVQILALVLCG